MPVTNVEYFDFNGDPIVVGSKVIRPGYAGGLIRCEVQSLFTDSRYNKPLDKRAVVTWTSDHHNTSGTFIKSKKRYKEVLVNSLLLDLGSQTSWSN